MLLACYDQGKPDKLTRFARLLFESPVVCVLMKAINDLLGSMPAKQGEAMFYSQICTS